MWPDYSTCNYTYHVSMQALLDKNTTCIDHLENVCPHHDNLDIAIHCSDYFMYVLYACIAIFITQLCTSNAYSNNLENYWNMCTKHVPRE